MSGMSHAWHWKSTVQQVVEPNRRAGWIVDYYGVLQRGSASSRSSSSWLDAGISHQTSDFATNRRRFERAMQRLGARAASVYEVDAPDTFGAFDRAAPGFLWLRNKRGRRSDINQFHNLMLVTRDMLESGLPYGWALRIREDAGWYAQLRLDSVFGRADCCDTTYFKACMHWDGLNDKAWLGRRQAVGRIGLGLWGQLLAKQAAALSGNVAGELQSTEQLLKIVVYDSGLPSAQPTAAWDPEGRMTALGLPVVDAVESANGSHCFKDLYYPRNRIARRRGSCWGEHLSADAAAAVRICPGNYSVSQGLSKYGLGEYWPGLAKLPASVTWFKA